MKKDLAKKIISISAIAVVVALVITTIVLALVPKKMANPIADGYSFITVYQDSKSAAYSPKDEHNEIIDNIKDLHEKSLKDNMLSAIFQGTGSFKPSVEKSNVTSVRSKIAEAEGNALVFTYMEEQTLKINGEVYKDTGTLSASTVTFDCIIMPLTDGTNFQECKIYLVDSEENKSSYQVTFLACQAELNEYVSSIELGLAN
jgi:hypothetical protein